MLRANSLTSFGAVLRYDDLPRQQAVGQNLASNFTNLADPKII